MTRKWKALLGIALAAGIAHVSIGVLAAPAANKAGNKRVEIRLQQATFDPLRENPDIPSVLRAAHGLSSDAAKARRAGDEYRLVQFNEPIKREWREQMEREGIVILDYVPDFAYVVRLPADSARVASVLSSTQAVRWIGTYEPAYKIPTRLIEEGALDPLRNAQMVQLLVRGFAGEPLASLRSAVESKGATVEAQAENPKGGSTLRISVPLSAVADLARTPAIAWIERYVEPAVLNAVARGDGILKKDEVERVLGLYGAGQAVAVVDTGLSTGDPATVHQDFAGRVIGGSGGATCADWGDTNQHGTHVAGTVLGSGVRSGSDPANHQYEGSNAGVAPEALLYVRGGCGNLQLGASVYSLFKDIRAIDDRLRVLSNSWGAGGIFSIPGSYETWSREVDQVIWEYPDLTVVFAAGNSGADANADGIVDPVSLTVPSTAKSVITVGASENQRPDTPLYLNHPAVCPTWGADNCPLRQTFPAEPIFSDGPSDNPNGIAAFSSRGPTLDGRLKPDIVAPGSIVVSARSERVPPVPRDDYDDYYRGLAGTSMATPMVSGGAAIVREFYNTFHGVNATAALVKATLINGAHDVTPGQYGTGPRQEVARRPDTNQGWGRMDLGRSLFTGADDKRELWFHEHAGLETEQEYRAEVFFGRGSPVRVTLVWNDYPGLETAHGALVNDLDLTVIVPNGTVYRGNHMLGLDDADRVNNVEGVDISAPVSGYYTVIVRAYNVAFGPQPFALVATGEAKPVEIVPAVAAVCNTSDSLGADITLTAIVGGATTLATTGLPAGAASTFNPNPVAFPANLSHLTVSGLTGVPVGTYPVALLVDDGDTEVPVEWPLTVYATAPSTHLTAPANQALDVDLRPTFSWGEDAQPAALNYRIQVSTDDGFNNLLVDQAVTGTSFVPAERLPSLTRLYWRVRAENSCGDSWSQGFEFRTRAQALIALDPPELALQTTFLGSTSGTVQIGNPGTRNLLWNAQVSATGCGNQITPVPWMSIAPTSGNRPAGTSQALTVSVDATQGALPADLYRAYVCVNSNDEDHPLVAIPITLTVNDANAGVLEGTITSRGYCSASSFTQYMAQVTIQGRNHTYTRITDTEGRYRINLNAGDSPVTVTASYEGHLNASSTVTVSAGQTTVANLAMTRDAPCATTDPTSYEETLELGDSDSFELDIRNLGAGRGYSWSLQTAVESCDSPSSIAWLSNLSHTSGNLPADGSDVVSFDVDTAALAHGRYPALLCLTTNDPRALRITVPFTLNVHDPHAGFLQGRVTSSGLCDRSSGLGIGGATITVTGSGGLQYQGTTNYDGSYVIAVRDEQSPVSVVVQAPNHVEGSAQNLPIVGEQTTPQDFLLDQNAACISLAPAAVSATAQWNQTVTQAVEIGNTGNQPLIWAVETSNTERLAAVTEDGHIATFSRTNGQLINPRAITLHEFLPMVEFRPYLMHGLLTHPDNPDVLLVAFPGEQLTTTHTKIQMYSISTGAYLGVFADSGDAAGTVPQALLRGLELSPINGNILAVYDGVPSGIMEFDRAGTYVRSIPLPEDIIANQFVLLPRNLLVRDNDILLSAGMIVGIGSFVHELNHDGSYVRQRAFNVPGEGFFITVGGQMIENAENHILMGYRRTATTSSGGLEDFGGIIEFDEDGRYVAFRDAPDTEEVFGVHQTANGDLLVGTNNGVLIYRVQTGTFDTAYLGAYILGPFSTVGLNCMPPSWASLEPSMGNERTATVRFDSTGLQPGTYTGHLCLVTNDPTRPITKLPLSLEVTLPPNYGTLEGVVRSQGYCNASTDFLAGVTVNVPSAATPVVTDSNGRYRTYLPAGASPLDVGIAAAGHLPATASVQLNAGQTTVRNFDLLLDAPCVGSSPQALNITLDSNQTANGSVQLRNVGGNQVLNWTMDTASPKAWGDDKARVAIVSAAAGELDCDSPSSVPWLTANPLFGQVPAGGSSTVEVLLNSTGLAGGVYEAGMCIFSNDPVKPALALPVTLTVRGPAPQPSIQLLPDRLVFSVAPDDTDSDTLGIGNAGFAPLTWGIFTSTVAAGCESSAAVEWLLVSPLSGTLAPDADTTVTVAVNSDGLPLGTHGALLCVNSNDPTSSLLEVPVTLTVTDGSESPGVFCDGFEIDGDGTCHREPNETAAMEW